MVGPLSVAGLEHSELVPNFAIVFCLADKASFAPRCDSPEAYLLLADLDKPRRNSYRMECVAVLLAQWCG